MEISLSENSKVGAAEGGKEDFCLMALNWPCSLYKDGVCKTRR